MTQNQIEYLKVLEQRRSNVANERLTQTRDDRSYQTKVFELSEGARHNKMVEDQALQTIGINAYNAQTNRYNYEVNLENARTNARNAATNERNAAVNERNAETNLYNAYSGRIQAYAASRQADVASARQLEDARHNRYSEAISEGQLRVSQNDADTKSRQATIASKELVVKQQQADAAAVSAQGAYMRGEGAKISAEAAQRQAAVAEARESRQNWDTFSNVVRSLTDIYNAGTNRRRVNNDTLRYLTGG